MLSMVLSLPAAWRDDAPGGPVLNALEGRGDIGIGSGAQEARLPDIDMRWRDARARPAALGRRVLRIAMCMGCDMAISRRDAEQIVNVKTAVKPESNYEHKINDTRCITL
jgi:hypothetical protein